MSHSIKLKASLPTDRQDNGMADLRQQLLASPTTQHVAIVVFDCHRIVEDIEDGIRTPVARILRIEPETDPDRAAQLLARRGELSEERCPVQKPLLGLAEAAGVPGVTVIRTTF